MRGVGRDESRKERERGEETTRETRKKEGVRRWGKEKRRWEERTGETRGEEEELCGGGLGKFGSMPCYCSAAKSPLGPVSYLSS